MMLSSILGIFESAVHVTSELQSALDWYALPDEFVVQVHCLRTSETSAFLDRLRIQPIGIVRHPLDVLISILHFCGFNAETAQWLGGEGGNESAILGQAPTDPAFLDYALSPRARLLLSVSAQWVASGYAYVRYEDLVASPGPTLERFLEAPPHMALPIETVVRAHSIAKLRGSSRNPHFWQGQPGLWRSLIPEPVATQIYRRHRNVFDSLGYTIEGARDLSKPEIEMNWRLYRW
jgi:hypothetical protein